VDSAATIARDILGLNRLSRRPAPQDTIEGEVAAYFREDLISMPPLSYWQVCNICCNFFRISYTISIQENHQRYPTIFALAVDILPIQASSVPCERVFSSGKETMTACRSRILPALIEQLQILKYSIRQGDDLDFTHGMDWGVELSQLEMVAAEQVPEDVNSFISSLLQNKT